MMIDLKLINNKNYDAKVAGMGGEPVTSRGPKPASCDLFVVGCYCDATRLNLFIYNE